MSVGSSSGPRELFIRSAPAILREIIGGTRGSVRIWLMREDGEKRRLQQAEGLSEGRSRMCEPLQHQIAASGSWRQADDAQLWYRHAGVFGVGRRKRSGLRSTGNGAVLCGRGYILSDWPVGLVA